MRKYSQQGEDVEVLSYFEDYIGTFLDIGAYNGKEMSNTYALAEQGWSGVCVEASPQCFVQLQKTYKDSKKVKLVNAFIGSSVGCRLFFDHGGATATASTTHKKVWESQVPYQQIHVASVRVIDILDILPGPYDFISIDVEGVDLSVLKGMPGNPYQILGTKMFCVEVSERRAEIMDLMKSRGYQVYREFSLGPNVLFTTQNQWR
jgi:FkbM family methyltransferase